MTLNSRVPHIGIFRPDEVRLLREVVRQVLTEEHASHNQEGIARSVAKNIFNAYRNGASEREELVRRGKVELNLLNERSLAAGPGPDVTEA